MLLRLSPGLLVLIYRFTIDDCDWVLSLAYLIFSLNLLLQCVCDWDNREKMFIEVEGILRRQIKVSQLLAVLLHVYLVGYFFILQY